MEPSRERAESDPEYKTWVETGRDAVKYCFGSLRNCFGTGYKGYEEIHSFSMLALCRYEDKPQLNFYHNQMEVAGTIIGGSFYRSTSKQSHLLLSQIAAVVQSVLCNFSFKDRDPYTTNLINIFVHAIEPLRNQLQRHIKDKISDKSQSLRVSDSYKRASTFLNECATLMELKVLAECPEMDKKNKILNQYCTEYYSTHHETMSEMEKVILGKIIIEDLKLSNEEEEWLCKWIEEKATPYSIADDPQGEEKRKLINLKIRQIVVDFVGLEKWENLWSDYIYRRQFLNFKEIVLEKHIHQAAAISETILSLPNTKNQRKQIDDLYSLLSTYHKDIMQKASGIKIRNQLF